jgi:hypothetical protein
VPRTLFTALGEFTYRRTYFDTPEGRRYLLDGLLGVGPYERIDSGVSAKLVNTAAMHSYGKSTDIITGGRINRQSVRNKALNTREVVHVPERAEKTPESLHIFADEDHVNLQNGKNCIVTLVTVCEGKKPVCKGRNELTRPFHFHGYGLKPEKLWEYVYAVCAEKYDMSFVKKVYIYGDGAPWIEGSADVFPEAVKILDAFHFRKRMKSLFAGEPGGTFALPGYNAVKRNDREGFDETVKNMIGAAEEKPAAGKEREKKIKSIGEHSDYILNHWDSIQNMKLKGAIGSATEAMVSHVLSERLSRSPMGWSDAGLSKMAMIRVFVLNGGKIEPADIMAGKRKNGRSAVTAKFEKYEEIVKKQQEQIFKDAKGWRWFEPENMISGKRTGTGVALDALARTRKIS